MDARARRGRRDARARRHPAAGRFRRLAGQGARRSRRQRLTNSSLAQGQPGGHVLRHRRHLAVARQGAPGAARLSAAHGPALRGRRRRPARSSATRSSRRSAAGKAMARQRAASAPAGATSCPTARRCSAKCCGPGKFERVVFSALGVREGYLHGAARCRRSRRSIRCSRRPRKCRSCARARRRMRSTSSISPADFIDAIGIAETPEDERLRKVACYLADIGWRGHPDYRGEQSVDLDRLRLADRRRPSRPGLPRRGAGGPLHGPQAQERQHRRCWSSPATPATRGRG